VVCTGSDGSFSVPKRRSSTASATTMPAMPGMPSKHASVCSSTGRPASTAYCFGSEPPKRSPRPAAGTTTQRLIAIVILVRSRRVHDLIESLVFLDHAELGARTLLDRRKPGLQVRDFG